MKHVRFLGLVFHNGWQEPLNGFAPNSHGRRAWSFAWTTLNVKVKSQRSRSPGTKNTLCTHNTPTVWTEWNALIADNAAQAANAMSRLLQRGVFAAILRWAWWATAGLCHVFLVMAALWNRAGHYIFALWFLSIFLLLLLFFPRLISVAGDWMSTILPHMVWP